MAVILHTPAPKLPAERPSWVVPYWINTVDPVTVARVEKRTLQEVYHAYTWLDLSAAEDSGLTFADMEWSHSDLETSLQVGTDL